LSIVTHSHPRNVWPGGVVVPRYWLWYLNTINWLSTKIEEIQGYFYSFHNAMNADTEAEFLHELYKFRWALEDTFFPNSEGTIIGDIFRFFGGIIKLFKNENVCAIRDSIFDPKAPCNLPSLSGGKVSASGCGTTTAFEPMREDAGMFFADVNIYLRSLALVYSYGYSLYSGFVGSNVAGIDTVLLFSVLDLYCGSCALVVFLFTSAIVFFVVVLIFLGFKSSSVFTVAILLETISVCLVVITSSVG